MEPAKKHTKDMSISIPMLLHIHPNIVHRISCITIPILVWTTLFVSLATLPAYPIFKFVEVIGDTTSAQYNLTARSRLE